MSLNRKKDGGIVQLCMSWPDANQRPAFFLLGESIDPGRVGESKVWPFSCDVACCMKTVLQSERSELEQAFEREMLEAALRSAIENVHSRSGFQHRIIRDFPVRIVVLTALFSLSGGIAAALIHSGITRAADSLFRLAGF
jgi:hypothetical protein